MPDQNGPNWRECMSARAECQAGIYRKLDAQHGETLTEVGKIREILAEQRGRVSGETDSHDVVEQQRFPWREIILPVIAAVLTSAIMGGLYAWFARGVATS